MNRHVLMPGGLQTCCGMDLPFTEAERHAGHVAGHDMQGRICRKCRVRLGRFPQLVANIAHEIRDSGNRCDVRELTLSPIVTTEFCPECNSNRGRPHHHLCKVAR